MSAYARNRLIPGYTEYTFSKLTVTTGLGSSIRTTAKIKYTHGITAIHDWSNTDTFRDVLLVRNTQNNCSLLPLGKLIPHRPDPTWT